MRTSWVTVVTPEHSPLSLFGEQASAAVAEELAAARIVLKTGVVGRVEHGGLALEPGGERLDVQRVFAVPRLLGPGLDGLPADDEGFILADDGARVDGCRRTWAAGDGVVSPVKFGSLATHQARRAVAAIARLAGVEDAPDPGEPVLHGRLLVGGGRTRRLRGRGTPPEHRSGGRRARSRASTCRAGWRSTGSHRGAPRSHRRRASRSAGRCARCKAPRRATCTSSRGSSAAPTRRPTARLAARCTSSGRRRGSQETLSRLPAFSDLAARPFRP